MRSPPADLTNEEEVSAYIKERINVYSNFPKPGALFCDVTSLLLDPIAFQIVIDALKVRYANQGITHVVSTESRGFIFGAPLALALQAAFVPVRCARRLPGDVVGVDFVSGYFSGRMEIHQDAIPVGGRVVIIDDLVACENLIVVVVQGKTLKVTVELVEKLGGEVVECGCVIKSLHMTESLKNIPLYGLTSM